MEVLKVSSKSNPNSVAGAMAGVIRQSGIVEVQVVGAGALNQAIKDGADVVGNRTRVKVVKNKCSAPFKQAEFDIMYGRGISREGSLLDVGVDLGIVKKSGAWYTYEGEQLGQGREKAKEFLTENLELMIDISERIRQQVGLGDVQEKVTDPDDAPLVLED